MSPDMVNMKLNQTEQIPEKKKKKRKRKKKKKKKKKKPVVLVLQVYLYIFTNHSLTDDTALQINLVLFT